MNARKKAIRRRLGGFLGRLKSVLETSWARLGASWAVLERLGGVLGRLGASWARLGSVLGRLGGVLGRLGGFLGRFWIAKRYIPSWTRFSFRCLLDFRPNFAPPKTKKTLIFHWFFKLF